MSGNNIPESHLRRFEPGGDLAPKPYLAKPAAPKDEVFDGRDPLDVAFERMHATTEEHCGEK